MYFGIIYIFLIVTIACLTSELTGDYYLKSSIIVETYTTAQIHDPNHYYTYAYYH